MSSKASVILDRFGANLDESVGAGRSPISLAPVSTGPSRNDGVARLKSGAQIDVGRITPDPGQPRKEFDPDELARLSASLVSHGQLQPISVRWVGEAGLYYIVSGERRWRAARDAGLAKVDAVIVEGDLSPAKILEAQLVENALRVDLSVIDQAQAYRTLMEANGWTGAKLAESLNIAPAAVSQAVRLLDLPTSVQESVEAGRLAPSVAYQVSKLDDPGEQLELAARVESEGLTRSDVEAIVRARPRKAQGKAKSRAAKVTSRTFKAPEVPGLKVTVERGRGLDDSAIVAGLRHALAEMGHPCGG